MREQNSGRGIVVRQANRWVHWFIVIVIGPQSLFALRASLDMWSTNPQNALACLAVGFVGVAVSYLTIVKLLHTGPLATLTSQGLVAHAHGPAALPWHAIKEIRIIRGRYASVLVMFERSRLPRQVRDASSNWFASSSHYTVSFRRMDIDIPLGDFTALVADHWERALKERDRSFAVEEENSFFNGQRFLPTRNGRPLPA